MGRWLLACICRYVYMLAVSPPFPLFLVPARGTSSNGLNAEKKGGLFSFSPFFLFPFFQSSKKSGLVVVVVMEVRFARTGSAGSGVAAVPLFRRAARVLVMAFQKQTKISRKGRDTGGSKDKKYYCSIFILGGAGFSFFFFFF